MSRLFEKLESGKLALGTCIKGAAHFVSNLANAGFDFVRPDMMFSAIDWKELEQIIRAAQLTGITPWVRVAANPWLAGEENLQVVVEAARAYSLGAEVVQVSVASAKQVEALIAVSKDWHRSAAGRYPSSLEELNAQRKKISKEALFMPSIESLNAIRDIESILSVDGLRAVYLAMGDFVDQLGHPFDPEHPEVWKVFDRIVKSAHARGIKVCANTTFAYKGKDAIIRGVKLLQDHGAQMIMVSVAEYLMQQYFTDLLEGVHSSSTDAPCASPTGAGRA